MKQILTVHAGAWLLNMNTALGTEKVRTNRGQGGVDDLQVFIQQFSHEWPTWLPILVDFPPQRTVLLPSALPVMDPSER